MELAQALSGAAATNAVLLNSTSWLAASGNDRVALVTICRMTLPLLSARDTGNEHSHDHTFTCVSHLCACLGTQTRRRRPAWWGTTTEARDPRWSC